MMNRSRQETSGHRNTQPEGTPFSAHPPRDTSVFVPESAILRVLFRSRRCAEVCEALIVCCRSPACSFRERVRVKFSHGKCAPIRSNSFFRSRHGSPQERNFYSLSIAADSRGVFLGYTSLYWETRHIVRALHQMLCYSRSSSILAGKMRLAGKAKLEGPSAGRRYGKEGAHGHHRC